MVADITVGHIVDNYRGAAPPPPILPLSPSLKMIIWHRLHFIARNSVCVKHLTSFDKSSRQSAQLASAHTASAAASCAIRDWQRRNEATTAAAPSQPTCGARQEDGWQSDTKIIAHQNEPALCRIPQTPEREKHRASPPLKIAEQMHRTKRGKLLPHACVQ